MDLSPPDSDRQWADDTIWIDFDTLDNHNTHHNSITKTKQNLRIGQIGHSLFCTAYESGPPFVIVWISPYEFSETNKTRILGVIFPKIRYDKNKTWSQKPVSFSPFIRPGAIHPKRIPKANGSWNDYLFDDTGYTEAKGMKRDEATSMKKDCESDQEQGPVDSPNYYPVHLLVPDLEPFQTFVDPAINMRKEFDGKKQKNRFDTVRFASASLYVYKPRTEPIPPDYVCTSPDGPINRGTFCPGNVLTSQEFNGFIQQKWSV